MSRRKSAVATAVEILELLVRADGIGPRAAATQVAAPKSTVHRILEELAAVGVLTVDGDGRYRIGTRFHAMAAASVANNDLVQVAQPVLRALQEETGETAILAMASQHDAVIIARARSSHPIQYVIDPGTVVPLHSGAVGKAILAWLPDEQRDAYLSGPLRKFTDRTIVEPALLRADLEGARARGYAHSRSERVAGAFGVAAPVWDRNGIAGAVGITAPEARIDPDSVEPLGRRVRKAATSLSVALGAPVDARSGVRRADAQMAVP